ncbi:MAG: PspC domain-containing protein [Acidimicrobiia bacterium]|nr:PspC domain-containing protein [Acidimicrobiia bacterium]
MDTHNTTPEGVTEPRRLERPTDGRVLGGVAAGIARHTGASVALIRLGFLVAALFGGFGILLYAAAWVLIPGNGESTTPAERWLQNLTTPGKRAGAFLIGLAALVILAGAAPLTILVAVVLLAAAALLADGRNPNTIAAGAAAAPASEETE